MNFSDKLRARLTTEIFSQTDVSIALHRTSRQAVHSGISRSLRSGDILKLKRGLYLFGERLRKQPISRFLIANKLYTPSYISFESALSYHGLVPEAVYVTTSACYLRKKKSFGTGIGEFSYDFIPVSPFFLNVEQTRDSRKALMAGPLKALFDLAYCKKLVYLGLEDMENDLRIDIDALRMLVDKHSYRELEYLASSYRKRNIMALFQLLVREMK